MFLTTARKAHRYHRKWISIDDWATLIAKHFPQPSPPDGVKINRAFSCSPEYKKGLDLDVNNTGIHRKIKSINGKQQYFYLVCDPGETIKEPKRGKQVVGHSC